MAIAILVMKEHCGYLYSINGGAGLQCCVAIMIGISRSSHGSTFHMQVQLDNCISSHSIFPILWSVSALRLGGGRMDKGMRTTGCTSGAATAVFHTCNIVSY